MMKVGIVGMPNAGKSSLFNALSQAGAEAANYPFTTIEPNVAVVPVQGRAARRGGEDHRRLEPRAGHDRVPRHRRASSPARARARASATSSWPTSGRPTRCCTWSARIPTTTSSTRTAAWIPAADIETIETELLYADLDSAERRHARVVREARSGDRAAVAEEAWLRLVIEALQSGRPARSVPVPHDAPEASRNLSPLTGKPVLFVANVNEGDDAVPSAVADHAAATGAAAVAISSRVEAELRELDDDEAAMMREELGVGESGLNRVVRGAFGLLDLIAFFTAGEDKPAQSWHLRNGLSAWHAAGQIHSDIQKGFVRAEVIGWEALVEAGGYSGARDRGTLRLEGRDYLMTDGDVITVKFTP